MTYETITTETRDAVTLITLNRPKALNALNTQVLDELIDAFAAYQADDSQRCAVLTGSGEKAFAAGADIKEMADKPSAEFYAEDFFAKWTSHIVKAVRKPWIAAVNGFALGGGCELAMMADFILASDSAKFGQPEIKLGVAPGMGGSQRLTRAVGKSKAMEMCLTGRMMDAEEAERAGLVARVGDFEAEDDGPDEAEHQFLDSVDHVGSADADQLEGAFAAQTFLQRARIETHQISGESAHLRHLEGDLADAGAYRFILEAIGMAYPVFAALIGAGLEKISALDFHGFVH